jgi:hypothetical protein
MFIVISLKVFHVEDFTKMYTLISRMLRNRFEVSENISTLASIVSLHNNTKYYVGRK